MRILLALLLTTSSASIVSAQDRSEICLGVGVDYAKPAVAEWSYWLGIGGGVQGVGANVRDAFFGLRAGAGVDFSLARFGNEHRYGGQFEMRLGPFVAADTTLSAHSFEGGAMIDFGQVSHAQWGTASLRLAAGATLFEDVWKPSFSLTIAWGVRAVRQRYSSGGGCVGADGELWGEGGGERRKRHAFASGARVFATGRVDRDGSYTFFFGLEFEPSYFLPPYSLNRFGGAPH